MPIFIYTAAERSGKTIKGEREAESERALSQTLKSEGLLILEAKEKKSFGLNINMDELTALLRPIGLVDKMFFSRNLAVMISAGLPLTRALETLALQSPNPRFRKIIKEANASVIRGKTLAESLRPHQKTFGELFINIIEVGEASGKLVLVLKLLARQMKKDHDLRRRVKGAMMYPAIILIALLGVGTFMMIYIVPTLTATVRELKADIPWTTQLIMWISEALVSYFPWLLTSLTLLAILVWRGLKTNYGQELWSETSIKLPLFGSLIKKFNTARFCRILAYLITSGVPIVRSLEITAAVLGNTIFRRAARTAADEIQKGKQLHAILEAYPMIFQPVVIQMISVGEETGKIAEMMLRLALFFEEEIEATTKNLSTIIEPILMIVIGVAVGFFAISMLQPIYSSLGNIGN